ncbi:ankyrin repeat domain-containing protein [Candidatus Berkiella aquae]|uniref:Ankyrin repeat domain-containing protein n=1 Tax=Candidatus Berkiella aquae TaxID=295108 RepID=A0A0Q9YRM9_9GAMM|nr:ankyrin repeat domain-containing protein [Candidatus Berkiella aquae]MCS5712279.1 ankyrin repeat domain-containing protein [Candidatus Berkiella aquae]
MLTFSNRTTYSQIHSQHLLLIAEGKTPSNIDGNTHKQLIELLARDGVNEDTTDFHQKYLYKYAHYCLAHRQAANPNCQDTDNGETPLIKAAACNDIQLMQLLISFKANIDDFDNEGNTALHVACAMGHLNAVTFLLDKDRGSVLSMNNSRQFPIHFAVRFPNIIAALLEYRSPINPLCNKMKTPLHYAVECNAPKESFEVLIQHSANFMQQDSEQRTPLQVGSNSVYLQSIGCDTQLKALEEIVTAKAKALADDAKWQFLLNLFDEKKVNLPAEIYQLILEQVGLQDFVSAAQNDDECKALVSSFNKMSMQ